jgi:hypothetical protein
MFLALSRRLSVLLPYNTRLLRLWTLCARQLLVQCCYSLETWRGFVRYSPLPEKDVDLLSHLGIHHVISSKNAQTFEKRLISEGFLKPCTGILDQCI